MSFRRSSLSVRPFSPVSFLSRLLSSATLALGFVVALMTAAASFAAAAPLTGTKNIPGDYADLATAITDLNAQGVGAGGVTLNLLAGNPQTAPSGGYVVGGTGSLVLTTTSSTAKVTIQGNGNTVTASGAQVSGAVNDAIFKLIGADWITLTGFTLQENAANTTTATATNNMTEWAVALLYVSLTDGSQNNTIQSNTISLNRTYLNTFGVYSNTRHSATAVTTSAEVTAATGSNSNNKVYGNAISNVNYGIVFIGAGTTIAAIDTGNDIGGSSAATGNTITNWGGGSAPTGYISLTGNNYCIFDNQQINDNVSFNTITSASLATAVTAGGILKNYSVASPTTGTITTTINNNTVTVTNNPSSASAGSVIGINNQGLTPLLSTATMSINNNTVQNCVLGGSTSTSNGITGITNLSLPGTLNMTGNSVLNNSITATTATTGIVNGLSNTGAAGTVNMNNNIVRGWASTATSGQVQGITNTGAVVTALNINSNQFGNASGGFFTTSTATSGSLFGISTSAGASTCALSVQNNDIRGITYNTAASAAQTYIINSAATLTQNISNNTFTNLNVNTTGSVTFISNNVALSATGSVTANGNSIVTAFNKPGSGGTVTLYLTTTTPSSAVGSTKSEQNNNFSNITLAGTTIMSGWTDLEGATGGGSNKTISNNTFSNWSCGSGAVTVLQTNFSGTGSTVGSNTISNITGTGAISGILIGGSNGGTTQSVTGNSISTLTSSGTGGNVLGIVGGSTSITTLTVSGNTISGLSSSGASAVVDAVQLNAAATANIAQNTISGVSVSGATGPLASGIHVVSGTTVNVTRNKLYDLSASAAVTATAVTPLFLQGGTTVTATNNLIGDLRVPLGNGSDLIRGINVTATGTSTTYNLYDNTVYLAATSSGANFGTTGIYHFGSATSTTSALNMRNNVVVNLSTPNGTGLTAAYRLSAASLGNYASTSNNNLLYAGTPGASRVIFTDGTNTDQTLAAYKSRVTPRDASSVTESAPFLSTTGSSAQFLHINPSTPTQIESGASPIAGVTDDYDGDTRNVTTPDIGADEGTFTLADLTGPTITYTPVSNTCSTAPQTLIATITDPSGVPTSGIGLPVLYWKINAGSYTAATGTFVSGNTYSFGFGSGVVAGDVVNYYIVAQDNAGTPNMNSQPTGASGFTANPPAASTPPGSPSSYTILQTLAAGTYAIPGAYATLTAAVADYNTKCLGGAVVFELAAGYSSVGETFPIVINANAAASAAYTLTIRPASGQTPTISGSLASGALIKLNGADYVTLDGSNSGGSDRSLTITNTSVTAPVAVWLSSLGAGAGATHNVVKNCVLTVSAGTSATTYGVAVAGATLGSGGADNDANTIQNNAITSPNIGVYANGTAAVSAGGVDSLSVSGNTFAATGTTAPTIGVQLANTLNATVSANTFSLSNSTTTPPVAISIETNVSATAVTSNRITSVVATNVGGYGGRGITVGTGNTGSNITIANNFIAGVNGSNWSSFGNASSMGIGIGMIGGSGTLSTITGGVNIYHNSVSMTGSMGSGSSTAITTGLYVGSAATAVNVRNNIFANTQTATSTTQKNYAVYSAAANSAFSAFSFNDYYVANSFNAGSAILGFLGSDQTTLSALNLAFTGNAGTSAYNTTPNFTSTTDLHIPAGTPSTLESAGASGTGITTDIDGDVRPGPTGSIYGGATANDVGADEFDGVPPVANDIAAAAFVSPLSGSSVPTGVAFTPQASFTNFGTAAQTNVQVRYRIVDPSSNEIYNDVAIIASISPAATVTVSFPSATLSSGGTHTLYAKAELVGDQTVANDEISGSLVGVAPLSGIYLIGVGHDFPTLTAAAAAANAAGVAGAVEFVLTDATYPSETFPITFNAWAGSSSTNTLWIHPKGGVTSTISGSSATSILKFNGADWITLDGSNNGTTSRDLTVANTNTGTTSAVIWMASASAADGATNNTIKNVVVQGNSTSTTLMGIYSGGTAISTTAPLRGDAPVLSEAAQRAERFAAGAANLGGGNGITAALTANSNNTYSNNRVSKAQYGIFLLGTSSSVLDQGTQVTGNTLGTATAGDGFQNAALWLQYQQGAVVSQNDMQNVTQTGTASADFYGLEVKDCKSLSVTRNALHNLSYAGTSSGKLFVLNQQGSAFITSGAPSANVYANNTIYGISSTSTSGFWAMSAINNEGGYGDQYVYNSVNATGVLSGGSSATVAMLSNGNNWNSGAALNMDVRNNIFSATGSSAAATKVYGHYVQGTSVAGSTLDYNDLRVAATGSAVSVVGRVNSVDQSTLAAWKTATSQEAHSQSVNPAFTSATDLHIAAPANGAVSPMADAGTPIAGVTTDADGEARSASTPDLGADEFATYALASSAGTGGSLAVSPAQPLYNPNSTVTLTATPSVGYVFSGWSGSYTGTTNPLVITMDAAKTVVANFTLQTFTIVSTTTTGGSIAPLGTTTVNYGDNITYTMVNDPHYHPVDVIVDGVAQGQPSLYTFSNVTANHTIDAQWAIDTYTITATANAHGSISPAGNTAVPYDGSQTYTITPDPGYHVSDVLVDAVSVGAVTSYTFSNVIGGHGIEAFFEQDETNTITPVAPAACITPGTSCVVVPVNIARINSPANIRGFSIKVQLSPELQLCSGTSSITEGSYLSTAGATVFQVLDNGGGVYTVDGAILGLPCGATAASGDLFSLAVTHTGTAGTGTVSITSELLRDCTNETIVASAGAPASLTIDLTPVVVAAIPGQTISEGSLLTVTPSVTLSACATGPVTWSGSSLPAGATVNPATGLFSWTPDCNAFEAGPYAAVTLTATDAAGNTGSATFALTVTNLTYTITASAGAGGAISPSGAVTVNCGGSQTFTITPDACYSISDVLVDGSSVGAVTSYTFSNVTAGHTIAASFTLNTYTITATAGAGGSISPSGAVTVSCGTNQSFTITPAACNSIADVLVDGVSVGAVSSYTFTGVTANHTIAASFTVNSYTIVATAGPNGTISPIDTLHVECGHSQSFVITPASACFSILDVKVDGVSVGAVSSYTFTNVTANHTIDASFTHVPAFVSPVTGLTATQNRVGNDTDGTTKITLLFTAPPSTTVEVYRAGYGNYPEYDDAPGSGSVPSLPSYPPSAPWTLTSVTASGQTDEAATRDYWYYVAFAKNACGDVSAVSSMTGGTLGYHLGDVTNGFVSGQGNNAVNTADISLLGAHYGVSLVANDPLNYLDVGPTTDHYINGRPLTDNVLQFEDLILYAINYGAVAAPVRNGLTVVTPAQDQLTVHVPALPAVGETFRVAVDLAAANDLQGLSAQLGFDGSIVEQIGLEDGAMLAQQQLPAMALSSKPGNVDVAVFGSGASLSGSGTVAILTFRVKAAGDPAFTLTSVDGRTAENQSVVVAGALESPKPTVRIPDVTYLGHVTPNPVRNTTAIAFGLHDAGHVRLAIFDVSGRLVRTLLDGEMAAGEQSIAWNATDRSGRRVGSGIYLARLEANGKVFRQTVQVVR